MLQGLSSLQLEQMPMMDGVAPPPYSVRPHAGMPVRWSRDIAGEVIPVNRRTAARCRVSWAPVLLRLRSNLCRLRHNFTPQSVAGCNAFDLRCESHVRSVADIGGQNLRHRTQKGMTPVTIWTMPRSAL